MRKTAFTITVTLLLLLATHAHAAKASKWQLCRSDGDCKITKTFCSCATAVNKDFEDAFAKFVADKKEVVECPKEKTCVYTEEKRQNVAMCDAVTNACKLKDLTKKTDPAPAIEKEKKP